MLSFLSFMQKLSAYHALKKESIRYPDSPIFHVQNNLPVRETFTEDTAYIIDSDDCLQIPKDNQNILWIILPNGTDDTEIPDWIENYVMLAEPTIQTELTFQLQHILKVERRIEEAHYKLSQCLINRKDVNTILSTGAELLENPLFLSDTSTRVLHWSDLNELKKVDDELIQCIIKHNFVTSDLFEKYDYKTLLPNIEQTEHAFIEHSNYQKKKERLIVKIVIEHRYFGWIVVIPQKRPFEDGDCQILDILANVLSLELERNKIGFALSYRENLLFELISGRIRNQEEFNLRAKGFGWIPGEHFYTMAIGFRDAYQSDNQERSITAYKNHLGMIYPTYKAVCIGNILYLLLETEDLESVANNLDNFFQTYHLAAGCSHHFSNIIEFSASVEQSLEILRIGMKQNPRQNIYRFQEYNMPYLVSTLKKYSQPNYFCLPEILRLQAYDQEFGTDYLDTLQTYLFFRNVITAANHLHIHRNTMNYRIQKIIEITGLKLTEGEDLYKIWLSCLILGVNGFCPH